MLLTVPAFSRGLPLMPSSVDMHGPSIDLCLIWASWIMLSGLGQSPQSLIVAAALKSLRLHDVRGQVSYLGLDSFEGCLLFPPGTSTFCRERRVFYKTTYNTMHLLEMNKHLVDSPVYSEITKGLVQVWQNRHLVPWLWISVKNQNSCRATFGNRMMGSCCTMWCNFSYMWNLKNYRYLELLTGERQ